MSRWIFCVVATGMFLGAATPARADFIDFSTPSGDRGHSQTYDGGAITAYGYSNSGNPTDLYGKNGGFGEQGLGLTYHDNRDYEINSSHFIELDLAKLNPAGDTITLKIESLQSGETFDIFGSNSLGKEGTTLLASGKGQNDANPVDTVTFNLQGFDYISITSGTGDVLLGTLETASPSPLPTVPEPSSLALCGWGLAGLTWGAWRRRKGKQVMV